MGVVAARMVMTESQEETDASAQSGVPPAVLAVAMVAGMWARAAGLVAVNDMLFRGLFFIPLFTWFCIRVHKVTVATGGAPASSLTKLLAAKPLVYLGSISFAIFMIHGPLGQLFYKKFVRAHSGASPAAPSPASPRARRVLTAHPPARARAVRQGRRHQGLGGGLHQVSVVLPLLVHHGAPSGGCATKVLHREQGGAAGHQGRHQGRAGLVRVGLLRCTRLRRA